MEGFSFFLGGWGALWGKDMLTFMWANYSTEQMGTLLFGDHLFFILVDLNKQTFTT